MEVPEEVLQVLKCSRCEGLLSCAPVYLCSKSEGLCNTCYSDEADTTATRNTHYEAVAQLLLFPCKNQDEGCKVKIAFNDRIKHEEVCPYIKYACPLQSSSVCDWSGAFGLILDHCKDQHPDKVLDSPSTFTHDITEFSSHTYLLRAFQLLFLLFTKVCVTSGNIYYSIRYIGSSSEANNFKYNLTITRKNETVTKEGKVDPQECLAFHEDSSLIIKISNLLDIFGGFDDTLFTVTMQQIYLGGKEKCSKCGLLLKVMNYNDSEGWKCVHCAPNKKCCSQKGCTFKTFPGKLPKHDFFCKYYTRCRICGKPVTDKLVQHYEKEHRKYSNDSANRIVEKTLDYFFVSSDAGTAMCRYFWEKSNFELSVFVPLSNDELSNFRCKVKVIELTSGHIRTYTPKISYHTNYDWLVTVTEEDFNEWSDSFDIFVNAKLNGKNHVISPSCRPVCFKRPCMVMGADVTHPSPDQRDIPSVAAVTASYDATAFRYNFCWRLQSARQEIIEDLQNIVQEQLLAFYRVTKYYPERIIFFRDGVSEGQFKEVMNMEVQAIKRACGQMGTPDTYKPQITFVVVQKRHHTRFFPTNPRESEDRNMNVRAGTVVDTDITHPTALEYYLVSHASIQGVARPTKYRVLYDEATMNEDELEQLTYYLCHMFSRCTRSVSYPAPTYYAHLAAFRARHYLEGDRINLDNLPREQASRNIQPKVKEMPMFFV